MMLCYQTSIQFVGRYVGHPYTMEQFRLIEITKESGMNRARSSANKRKSLEEQLRLIGMTHDQFLALKAAAERPFFTNADGFIYIRSSDVLSFLVATSDEARAAQRPCNPDQVRSRFTASDFVTNRKEPDGVWERFATVTAGTGNKLSNQRGLRQNSYIENATASGQLWFDDQFVKPDVVRNALVFGGQFVGIGASRKMGMGRFTLARFERDDAAVSPFANLMAAE